MPDPKNYKDEESWMGACIPKLKEEGKDQDQAVAQCMNMWKERDAEKKERPINLEEERRFFQVEELRIDRAKNSPPKIVGYAAVFNSMSEDLGGFREKIAPGAFRKAIKTSDVRALFNHDPNIILGRTTSGTLKLSEDSKGLFMELTPPDTQLVRDMVITPIERGDINQQSFGFTVKKDSWEENDGEIPTRTLDEINELFDVSPVTYPAYKDTNVSIALRSLEKSREEKDKPKFEIVSEPKDWDTEIRNNLEKLKEMAKMFGDFIAELESQGKPMQAGDENEQSEGAKKEGEAAEPMQGEEARDLVKEKMNKKFEKYGLGVFKYEDHN